MSAYPEDQAAQEWEARNRPFVKGDEVVILDSRAIACGKQRVVRANSKVVVTDCGREWRQGDGWWIGNNGTWPFPTIELAAVHELSTKEKA